MDRLQIERLPLNRSGLGFDLANHLYTRLALGSAAIIAEHPEELMRETKRAIFKITHRLQRQRSTTSDVGRLIEVSNAISRLQTWRLSASSDDFNATVQFGTAAMFLANPPAPQILYVTCQVDAAELDMVTSWMKAGDLVVAYN